MDSGWRLVAVERVIQGVAYSQRLISGVAFTSQFGTQGNDILERLRQMGVDAVSLSAYGDDPFAPPDETGGGGDDTFEIDGPDGPMEGIPVEIYDPDSGDLLGTLTTGADGTVTFDPAWPAEVDVEFDIPDGDEVTDDTGTHTGTYRHRVRRLTSPKSTVQRQLHYMGYFYGYSGGSYTAIVGVSVAVQATGGMTTYGVVLTDSSGNYYARTGNAPTTNIQVQFDVPAGWKLAKPWPDTGFYMPGEHVTDLVGSFVFVPE